MTRTVSAPLDGLSYPPESSRNRLDFLDGLRGLAALYVVIHHAYMNVNWNGKAGLSPLFSCLGMFLSYGHIAVIVFIVLSGFCLMLPVTRQLDRRLSGGIRVYAKRRARRIFPPYLAALAMALLIIYYVPQLQQSPEDAFFGSAVPVTPGAIAAHLFLVHNFHPDWFTKIDPPMWSIAIEWQIYFIFPILLMFWRRFNVIGSSLAATLIAYSLHRLSGGRVDYSQPLYLAFFSLGMAGASVSSANIPGGDGMRKLPWGAISLSACGLAIGLPSLHNLLPAWWGHYSYYVEGGLVAFSAAALLTAYAIQSRNRGWVMTNLKRILENRWFVLCGGFSYSLYLIHFPLLSLLYLWVRQLDVSADLKVVIMLLSASLTIIIAYPFHLAFERPFMSNMSTAGGQPSEKLSTEVALLQQ